MRLLRKLTAFEEQRTTETGASVVTRMTGGPRRSLFAFEEHAQNGVRREIFLFWFGSARRTLCAFAGLIVITISALGQSREVKRPAPAVQRTAWGDPDLQGIWDFATITPLERPASLAGKEVLTDQE